MHKLGTERSVFETKINHMSLGQQKKVLLSKSLTEPANVYLWDEPLNYLDIYNQEQLSKMILQYSPTMIIIEHNRSFIDKLNCKIVDLNRE